MNPQNKLARVFSGFSIIALCLTILASILGPSALAADKPGPTPVAGKQSPSKPGPHTEYPVVGFDEIDALDMTGASVLTDTYTVGGVTWSVGQDGRNVLVERYDGSTWSIIPTPSISGASFSTLNAINGSGPNDIWAVGYYNQNLLDYEVQPLIEHWNGSVWAIVNPQQLQGAWYNMALYDVEPIAAGDVWVVGSAWTWSVNNGFHNAVEAHYANGSWAVTTQNDPTNLYSLQIVSPSEIWATGELTGSNTAQVNKVYSGTAWVDNNYSPWPPGALRQVTGIGGDIWAVGHGFWDYGQTQDAPNVWRANAIHNWQDVVDHNNGVVTGPLYGVRSYGNAGTVDVYVSGRDGAFHFDGLAWNQVIGSSGNHPSLRRMHNGWVVGEHSVAFRNQREVPPTPTPTATATPTCSSNFSDVPQSSPFYGVVTDLVCRGAISGYSDGTFRPNNGTTRGQLSKIIVLASRWMLIHPDTDTFADVTDNNAFYPFVETAVAAHIISGYGCGGPGEPCDAQQRPYFRPNNPVTRAQLSKIVVLAKGWATDTSGGPHFSDVATDSAQYPFVETAYNHHIISGYGDGTFHPNAGATRGQIAKIVDLAVTQP